MRERERERERERGRVKTFDSGLFWWWSVVGFDVVLRLVLVGQPCDEAQWNHCSRLHVFSARRAARGSWVGNAGVSALQLQSRKVSFSGLMQNWCGR